MQVSPDPGPGRPAERDDCERIAATFKLLADPTRIRILAALDEHGELCVHEIAERVGTTETKVSQALRLLRTAAVVRNRRDGRHVHYRLDDDHVAHLLRAVGDHVAHEAGR